MPGCPECSEELNGDEIVCPRCLARLTAPTGEEMSDAPHHSKDPFQPVEIEPLDESAESEGASPAKTPPATPPPWQQEPLFQDSDALDTWVNDRSPSGGGWRGTETGEWSRPVTVTLPGRLGRLRWLFALALVLALVALGVGLGHFYAAREFASPAVSAFDLGEELFAQERYQAAQYLFGEAVAQEMSKSEPAIGPALAMMGWSAYHDENYAEAIAFFDAAMGMNSESPDAYIGKGLATLALGDPDEAETWLLEALDIVPDAPEVHRALGRTYLAQGGTSAALTALREARDLSPADHETELLLGMALYASEEYEEAADLLGAAVDLESDRAAMRALVDSYAALARHEEAVSTAARLLETDTTDIGLQYLYGYALLRANRLDEAEERFSQVLKSPLARLVGDAYRQLGLSLSNQEKYEEALVPLSKALVIVSDDAEVLELSGWALARLGRCTDALPLFEHALEIDAGRSGATEGRAACRQWLGL